VRQELERIPVPDAEAAAERAREVVLAAFGEREPVARERHVLRVAAIAVVAAALLGGALATPPGRAVLDEIREAVGVERAQPALFSLPAPGWLLVASDAGSWVVEADGSKRLLGPYREASWSPFGRFVVATGRNELAALEPSGAVRWTLARPRPSSPRWAGTTTDTRIAYLDATGIRVAAGDGTGDRLLTPERAQIAWRPRSNFVLGQLHTSELRLQDTQTGRVADRVRAGSAVDVIDWSWAPDGARAVVVRPWEVTIVDVERDSMRSLPFPARDVTAARVSPDGRELAVLRAGEVLVIDMARPSVRRRVFAGAGPFEGLAWSPDGRWLLVGWPAADQWVFVRADGRRIQAVANVSEQFRSQRLPRAEGWCCSE
jgi:hypothetical protein